MIFQHTWQKVVSGEKTQTRRIVKAGDDVKYYYQNPESDPIYTHVVSGKRTVYELDKTYAVQTGRGKAALWVSPQGKVSESVRWDWDIEYETIRRDARGWMKELNWHELRIRITDIRREDVRNISEADVKSEGFEDHSDFWHTWVSMHDKSFYKKFCYAMDASYLREYGFYDRPAEKYQAWVLTFEVVK